jgi:hypothetical protein
MDQARGKGRLSGFDKFNIGNMFLGAGIPSMIQLGISRRMGQNQGLEGLRQLANLTKIGISSNYTRNVWL